MLWIITVPQTAFKYLGNSILVALATLSSTSSKLMWKRKRHHQQWSNFLHQWWWWWWWQRKRRIWCHPRFELLPTKPRTNHQEIKCPKAMLLTLFTIHSNLCQCYQLEKKKWKWVLWNCRIFTLCDFSLKLIPMKFWI